MSAQIVPFPIARASGVERVAAHVEAMFGQEGAADFRNAVRSLGPSGETPSRAMADRLDAMLASGCSNDARGLLRLAMALAEVRA